MTRRNENRVFEVIAATGTVGLIASGVWLLLFSVGRHPHAQFGGGLGLVSPSLYALAILVHIASAITFLTGTITLSIAQLKALFPSEPLHAAMMDFTGKSQRVPAFTATGISVFSLATAWMIPWNRVSHGTSRAHILLKPGDSGYAGGWDMPPQVVLKIVAWTHIVPLVLLCVFIARRWLSTLEQVPTEDDAHHQPQPQTTST